MKKHLFKDISSFRKWQFDVSGGLDGHGQNAVSSMPRPLHFPALLVFNFVQVMDVTVKTYGTCDKLEYVYVYIDDFPMKEVKTGAYVYQMVKTDERFIEMLNR